MNRTTVVAVLALTLAAPALGAQQQYGRACEWVHTP